MEKCVFCGNTRKSAPTVRFFAVPREPGLKRIRWLYVLDGKEIGPKDRVCGIHFRGGRPSSDPSHEDFVPHLYLNREPPEEILSYLESLTDDSAATSGLSISSASASSRAIKQEVVQDMLKPAKPSILQRKRKQKVDEIEENPRLLQKHWDPINDCPSNTKVHILHKSIAEAVGAKHGQMVIIKRLLPAKRNGNHAKDQQIADEEPPRVQTGTNLDQIWG
ncbi:hypothetical protein DdX_04913 [Ditylenchus destructor]|uniref:THAP-type domain-containing protein n=1 Tax=Ditylenchus destructor TaxID=166010 RepID=A0AAD4R3Y6_9BILA|nr:hypothetical protein DdX_04913 [Ditylenchus destructor]